MTGRNEPTDMAPLADALEMMLPFAMVEACGLTPGQLATRASRAAVLVGSYGDTLQYGGQATGRKLSPAALAVGALAEGIAAAELLNPGGGRDLLHKLSPREPRAVRTVEPVDDRPWWQPLAELEALLDAETEAAS